MILESQSPLQDPDALLLQSHLPVCGIVREDEGSVIPDLSSMRVAVDMARFTQMLQHEIVRRRQMVEE